MVEFRPLVEHDVQQVIAMREAAFGLPRQPDDAEPELDGEYHVLADGSEVLGVLRVYRWSQWFGGNRVPTAGIASVTVAPKARGRGTGGELMARTLTMLRSEGVALSTLYPSTAAPYRRAGYELAGARVRYSLRITDLPSHVSGDVEPWGDDDLDDVRACYERFAASTNGMLDRSEGAWHHAVLAPSGDRTAHRYLVREQGEVTGYLVYSQETDTGRMPFRYVRGDTPYNYQMACRDLVATTPEAGRRMLAFLAGHRAMATNVLWTGPSNEPLDVLFPAVYGIPEARSLWMLRLVDLPTALEARGYPAGVETAVEFTVTDPTLDDNEGAYRLEVSGGAGKVSRIDAAEAHVDVLTLASLYSSWQGPHDAVRLGSLRGASPTTLADLGTVFGGPQPWMLDMF